MLVLTRSRGEKVVIQTPQGDVTLTVLAIRGDTSVKLGFEAPKDVLIHRAELSEPRKESCRGWCAPMQHIDLDPTPPEAST